MEPYSLEVRRFGAKMAALKGPMALRPPRDIDDAAHLDLAMRIVRVGFVPDLWSLGVFVDNTTNRETEFHPPVLRRARLWRGRTDPDGAGDLSVELVSLGNVLADINAGVSRVQAQLQSLPFVPYGLPLDRTGPDLEATEDATLILEAWNGSQRCEFTSRPTGDPLWREIDLLATALWAATDPIRAAGWHESYPASPGARWCWREIETGSIADERSGR